MRRVENVKEFKIGAWYTCENEEDGVISAFKVTKLEVAEEMYGSTSIMVNDVRWDVFEHEIFELSEEDIEGLMICYESPTNEFSHLSFEEYLESIVREDLMPDMLAC